MAIGTPAVEPTRVTKIEIGCSFYPNHVEEAIVKAHYYQTCARKTCCEVCGELAWCDMFAAEYPERMPLRSQAGPLLIALGVLLIVGRFTLLSHYLSFLNRFNLG